ncbi:type II toxin-antitoxin system RelE/ParE family toxin [Virgibacillus indicus]|uniref:type II toxin-antitoxin system RelE/ParE family toxin n=1 Tax=Virgibacillus indicus TaxID=2024554 RepID=UPI000D526A2B|nr:type II toxin-antitoxin system RelE/ParE family toxin [Virgibacillus indicus]
MVEDKYTLKFTLKAYEDLDEIYNYITNDLYNPSAADKLLQNIETNIISLKNFPFCRGT